MDSDHISPMYTGDKTVDNHPPPPSLAGALIRQDDQANITKVLSRGECCSIVGLSNTGKSIMLRQMFMESIQKSCSIPGSPLPLFVFVDCLESSKNEIAFYELLLRNILQTLLSKNIAATQFSDLRSYFKELLTTTSADSARSLFSISMHLIGTIQELNMVLVLDEFDDVYQSLPPWPFRQLRAIRDTLGPRLCYVTATSHYLRDLRGDEDTYEFRELFQMYTQVLKPLTETDRTHLLQYLINSHQLSISENLHTVILNLGGGHPGLMERLAVYFDQKPPLGDLSPDPVRSYPQEYLNRLSREILDYKPIQEECRRYWSELEVEEQAGLLNLLHHTQQDIQPDTKTRLIQKGVLLQDKKSSTRLFSPLFSTFLLLDSINVHLFESHGIRCDDNTGQIWSGNKEITFTLSNMQRRLIRFLYKQQGKTCTHHEIIDHVWETGSGVSPGAIYEMVKRVRMKIEDDWKNPRLLITIPGEGYRLDPPH